MATEVIGGDSTELLNTLNTVISRIEQVDKATTKSNTSLKAYTDNFDELNNKLKEYVRLSGNVKTQKFQPVKMNREDKKDTRGTQDSTSGNNTNNATNSMIMKNMEIVFKSIDSLSGRYGKLIGTNFKKLTSTVGDVKALNKGIKATEGLAKAQKGITLATTLSKGATASATGVMVGATSVVAGVTIALSAMGIAGSIAYERNMNVNRSLMAMGDVSSELTSSSSTTANKMISIGNTWKKIGEDLTSAFEPVFALIISALDLIGKAVGEVTGPLNKDANRQFSSTDSKARWYTNKLQSTSGELESTSLPVIGDIASTSKQSGFDNNSSVNLAIGTYNLAMKKAREYGVEASEVAKKLSEAWINGSDAAKEYGVVLDDQTLTGYMSSKGVDIANTQTSDAVKQYYRYQLMEEELKASSNDSMQEQIKQWKQLGMQIDTTKGKLFSFDEVIQLGAVDTSIPTVGIPNVTYPNGDGTIGTKPTTPPIIGGTSGNTSGTPSGEPSISPSITPIVEPSWESILDGFRRLAENIGSMFPVPVGVLDPDAETEGVLDGLREKVNNLITSFPILGEVDIRIPSYNLLEGIRGLLEGIRGALPIGVQIPVTVPNLGLAQSLLTYCTQLALSPFSALVNLTIPSLQLAPTLLNYLSEIAKNWNANLDITVVGQNLLQQAQSLLERVISLVQQAGQSVASGVSNAYTKVKEYFTEDSATTRTAKSMATTNGQNWDSLSATQQEQYKVAGNVVNNNAVLTKKDGIEMLNNYNATGQATSSKTDWMNGKGTDIANTALKGAGALALTGGTLLTGGAIAPVIGGIEGTLASWLSGIGTLAPKLGFATGGIGLKETTATLFENDKKEAVIPLESQAGIDYLSNAMQQAGAGQNGGTGGSVTVNLTLSGVNIADNQATWSKVAQRIAEEIDIQKSNRGELNYGSSF